MSDPQDLHWLVRPETIRRLWIGGITVLVALVIAGAFIEDHPHFGIDGTFGFSAWFGFTTCAAMVVAARLLGFVLKRKETYYDD